MNYPSKKFAKVRNRGLMTEFSLADSDMAHGCTCERCERALIKYGTGSGTDGHLEVMHATGQCWELKGEG